MVILFVIVLLLYYKTHVYIPCLRLDIVFPAKHIPKYIHML